MPTFFQNQGKCHSQRGSTAPGHLLTDVHTKHRRVSERRKEGTNTSITDSLHSLQSHLLQEAAGHFKPKLRQTVQTRKCVLSIKLLMGTCSFWLGICFHRHIGFGTTSALLNGAWACCHGLQHLCTTCVCISSAGLFGLFLTTQCQLAGSLCPAAHFPGNLKANI